jgi:hypothetical protein
MINKTMKIFNYPALLISFISLLSLGTNVNAQQSDFSVEVQIDYNTTEGDNNNIVTVTLDASNPEYIYLLYDKLPWEGGTQLQKSEPTYNENYTYANLEPGKYLICVADNDKNTKCKSFTVAPN